MRWSVVGLVGLAACAGTPPTYVGTDLYLMFPFDGVRTWEFVSTDPEISYALVAKMRSTEPDVHEDGHNLYPVDYFSECRQNDPDCVDGLIRTIVWANDEVDGTFIYAWTEGSNTLTFDPPLMIADTEMRRDDVLTTETGGATWTSRLDALESCPVRLNVDWQCAKMVLDDGDDNPATGSGLTGTYWATVGYNVVAIAPEGGEDVWELSKQYCEEDCAGVW